MMHYRVTLPDDTLQVMALVSHGGSVETEYVEVARVTKDLADKVDKMISELKV
jgi:hypothetical protein